jgi:hypothetical protein
MLRHLIPVGAGAAATGQTWTASPSLDLLEHYPGFSERAFLVLAELVPRSCLGHA